MVRRIYRVCRARYARLDGEGAKLVGGRWNSPGRAVVYMAESVALAVIENLVHMSRQDFPTGYVCKLIQTSRKSSRIHRHCSTSIRACFGYRQAVSPSTHFFEGATKVCKSNRCCGRNAFFDHLNEASNSTPTKYPISR